MDNLKISIEIKENNVEVKQSSVEVKESNVEVKESSELIKIRVKNQTSQSLRILLYQADVDFLSVANYKIGAWRQSMVASGGTLSAKMPLDIQVGAAEEGEELEVATKCIKAPQGSKFVVFTDDKGALDIAKASGENPDGTISVKNESDSRKWVKLYKDNAPILSTEIRPDFNQSIKIKPKITLAIAENEITTAFFDATQLSNTFEVDLSNQSYLTFALTENIGTGKITVGIDYDKF